MRPKAARKGAAVRSTESDRRIGERLRQERLLAGKSREEFARALGVGPEFVRAYERGATRIPAKLLVTAAEVLGVPVGLLFYSDETRRVSDLPQDAEAPARLAILRPPSILNRPGFSHVEPILRLWRKTRGELTKDVDKTLIACRLLDRTVLVRQPFRSSRLITQHFGGGIRVMRPCDALLIVGRDFDEHHTDREYGPWVSKSYAETLWSRQIRIESVRATVRTSTGATLRARYDRVLIPWRWRDGDRLAMALSLQREVPVVIAADGRGATAIAYPAKMLPADRAARRVECGPSE